MSAAKFGMKYHSAEVADVQRYIDSDAWAMEQKLDGVRCMVTLDDGEVRFMSHTGAPLKSGVKLHLAIADKLFGLPVDCLLDGELLANGELWVFDILALAGQPATHLSFEERRTLLENLFEAWNPGDGKVRLVESFRTAEGKAALWARVLASGAEGVIVKRASSTYSAASRSRDVLKIKVTKTVDVIVMGFGGETESAVLGMLKDGKVTMVGKCSLIGKAKVEIGDVIEVQYLYVVDPAAPRLYQGRMMRRRDDKPAAECTIDQLDGSFASKEVVAA